MENAFASSHRLRSAFLLLALLLFRCAVEAKDLYKILGVEKGASQRDIQKAFHRLSLQYHPDKNPSKDAQNKFAEINNAYEVLSDEEKRKNYDLFGEEHGRAQGPQGGGTSGWYSGSHDTGGHRNSQGWTHFTNDNTRFRFEKHAHGFGNGGASYTQGGFFNFPSGGRPEGPDQSSSFSFGGDSNMFGNIFDIFFGSARGDQGQRHHFTGYNSGTGNTRGNQGQRQDFTGYSSGTGNTKGSSNSNHGQSAQSSIVAEQLNNKNFKKKVLEQLYTWAILFVNDAYMEPQEKIQLLEQTATSLHGSIKVGYVNCDTQQALCKEQKVWPLRNSKLLLYSLRNNGKISALEYTGEWSPKDVKTYCKEVLPRFSMRIGKEELEDEFSNEENSPRAILLSKKKETPAMWRALSGILFGRVLFYDAQVNDDFESTTKKLGVDFFPAIVGILANGEAYVLSSGSKLEQTSSSIEGLKALIEELEKRSKSAGPRKVTTTAEGEVHSLTKKNLRYVCKHDTPLCIIAVFRTSSGKEKAKQILKAVSQKTLIQRGKRVDSQKNPVSYSVLDASKQSLFLHAFDKSGFKSKDNVLIAYKPKKGTYVSYDGPLNLEDVENFVIGVLGGDFQLGNILQDPVLE